MEQPDQYAYFFLKDGLTPDRGLTYAELDRRARAVAACLLRRFYPGDRLLLLYPPGLDFVIAFWGCLYAGMVAIPVPPPDAFRMKQSAGRLASVGEDAQANGVLTLHETIALCRDARSSGLAQEFREWIATDQLDEAVAESWTPPDHGLADLAYLQYTSGSTALPKGAMVSHDNLVHQCRCITEAGAYHDQAITLSWMPHYHDYGLVKGVLHPVSIGRPAYLMSPVTFLKRPLRWLQAIQRYGVTHSGGPNFAYRYCVTMTTPEERAQLDLSVWEVASCGAEPIFEETIEQFIAAYSPAGFKPEAFYPAYGMAEYTLLISLKRVGQRPLIQSLDAASLEEGMVRSATGDGMERRGIVSCGYPVGDTTVAIVDPATRRRCKPDRVGEIWLAGRSVTQGYWSRPQETAETFQASIEDSGEGPFLRTGDLGFMRDRQLYVTGRLKDLIIIRGRNHYPQDIERSVQACHASLKAGGGIAFSVKGEQQESLIIVQEVERHERPQDMDALADLIRRTVAEEHDLEPAAIGLVKPGTIPKTSSGKLQRAACRHMYLTGGLSYLHLSTVSGRPPEETTATMSAAGLLAMPDVERGSVLTDYLARTMAALSGCDEHRVRTEPLNRLGLDSLKAFQLLHRLESSLEITVPISWVMGGNKLEHLVADILGRMASEKAFPAPTRRHSEPAPHSDKLSYNQLALWLYHQLDPQSSAPNVAALLPIAADILPDLLHAALVRLGQRHSILTTTYEAGHGEPRCVVHQTLPPAWKVVDTDGWAWPAIREQAITAASIPFDLNRGPIWRAVLFKGETHRYLLLAAHHIAVDGTSMAALVKELRRLYQAMKRDDAHDERAGEEAPYRDFVAWQRELLAAPQEHELAAYWHQRLAGDLSGHEALFDRPRDHRTVGRYAWQSFAFDRVMESRLCTLARTHGFTLYGFLLSALQILIHRYTGERDILIGSPVSGRTRSWFAETIGDCVNIVPLRQQVDKGMTVSELVEGTQQRIIDALEHQDYPFALMVKDRQTSRNLDGSSFISVLFALQQFSLLPDADRALASGRPLPILPDGFGEQCYVIPQQGGQFPLSVEVSASEAGLAACFEYDADLFPADTIVRMQAHYRRIVEGMVEGFNGRIESLSLMDDTERRQVLRDFPRLSVPPMPAADLVRQFESQVRRAPDAPAVVHGDDQLSYGELESRANRLAQYLRGRGVGPEVLVGICLERSTDLIVGLLGVMKAGGAYLPLDPDYPMKRLEQMVEDAEIRVLLTESGLLSRLPSVHLHTICLDSEQESIARLSDAPLTEERQGHHLAYVLYTSGTTGRPKGVMIENRGLMNYVQAVSDHVRLGPGDRVLQFASIGFDAAAEEIFPCLTSGATLVLRTASMMDSMARFVEECGRLRISILDLPTAWWHELVARMEADRLACPPTVRSVIIGGEQALADVAAKWRALAPLVPVVNTYGPTEVTIAATIGNLLPMDEGGAEPPAISIGRPVPGAQVYVLDADLQPVPVGVTGELCVAGIGLARGYARRPELTAERFTTVSFEPGVTTRLYRTGDYGRWREDGSLEYQGRMDRQVKIRGHRIEPGEIEAVLHAHPDIVQAAVEMREDMPGDKRLVGFIVPRPGSTLSVGRLMQHLQDRLPSYMVPSTFVELTALPRTEHGKLDRRALHVPRDSRASRLDLTSAYVPPRSTTEDLLAQMWSEILHVTDVGIHDHFFELGGNSLLATQVVSRVRSLLHRELPLRSLFMAPTIAGLSRLIDHTEESEQSGVPEMVAVPRTGPLPLSFAQERMWFLHQLAPKSSAYAIPAAVRLQGPLNKLALRASVAELVRRHEALRTTFEERGGRPVQLIHPILDPAWAEQDLRVLPRADRERTAAELAAAEARRPFDLATGPLLRVLLLQLEEEQHVVVLTTHHIVSDQWSYGIIARELVAEYNAQCDGTARPLQRELELQYADFAQWQRTWLTGVPLEHHLAFWKNRLIGLTPLALPSDRPRPTGHSFQGDHVSLDLPWSLIQRLKQITVTEGVTLYMVFLAGFFSLLHRVTGQRDIVIGTPIANRNWLATEGMIGTFVNTLVLRGDISPDMDFRRVLKMTRDVSLDAYAHQDLPFEKLVEALQPDRGQAGLPLVQVLFNFANTPFARTDFKYLSWTPYEIHRGAAQFDLTLSIDPAASRKAYLEFSTELFDKQTAERWVRHYLTLLQAMVEEPAQPLGRLPLLRDDERRLLTVEWNATGTTFARPATVSELFEAQAERVPTKSAVSDHQETLSYAELNARANQLARHLQSLGVGPDVVVGVHMDQSVDLLVCLLGIMKAGGAYLPLVPGLPAKRMAVMLDTGRVGCLVTTSGLAPAVPVPQCPVVMMDRDQDAIGRQNGKNLPQRAGAAHLVYVLFTSGSTGLPKGVEVEHRGLTNVLESMRRQPGISEEDVLLSVTPLSFDIAGLELFLPLIAGAQVLLTSRPHAVDGAWLKTQLDGGHLTIMQATPATWRLVLQAGWRGARKVTVLCGGETLSADLARALTDRAAAVWNLYGPTETTIWSTIERVRDIDRTISLGRPIANTQVYVLDVNLEPVPIGIPGELYIGGVGVARGYRGNRELTSERFVPSPFQTGARLYRTGDSVRWLSDGRLEFLGRIDFQVKVRGFRVEPGEIETVLGQFPTVSQAVVIAPKQGEEQQLVAYVTLHDKDRVPFDAPAMRRFLRERLPDYMVPARIVAMDRFPLTPNGKIDRSGLPLPAEGWSPSVGGTVAPRDRIELQLAALWEQILGLSGVGVRDNFFDLGGHSLLALRMFSAIERVFGMRLPMALLFQAPTIEGLAEVLRGEGRSIPWRSLVAIQAHGGQPPFFVVPGVGGNVLIFARLARLLGEEQPFYGLQAQGLDGKAKPFTRIEDMARHYIAEIRTVQPTGPYRIGGTCTGGLVAHEMAQQLAAHGEEVILAVMESWHPRSYRTYRQRAPQCLWPVIFMARKLVEHVRLMERRRIREWPRYGWERVRSLRRIMREAKTHSQSEQTLYHDYVTYATFQAAARYDFRPYRGRVLNVVASLRPLTDPTQDTRLVFSAGNARRSRTVTVAAQDSGRLFAAPHVQELARHLQVFWNLEICPDSDNESPDGQASEAA
jgi:amino acid adenylation domain-containing protein